MGLALVMFNLKSLNDIPNDIWVTAVTVGSSFDLGHYLKSWSGGQWIFLEPGNVLVAIEIYCSPRLPGYEQYFAQISFFL